MYKIRNIDINIVRYLLSTNTKHIAGMSHNNDSYYW